MRSVAQVGEAIACCGHGARTELEKNPEMAFWDCLWSRGFNNLQNSLLVDTLDVDVPVVESNRTGEREVLRDRMALSTKSWGKESRAKKAARRWTTQRPGSGVEVAAPVAAARSAAVRDVLPCDRGAVPADGERGRERRLSRGGESVVERRTAVRLDCSGRAETAKQAAERFAMDSLLVVVGGSDSRPFSPLPLVERLSGVERSCEAQGPWSR